MNVHRSRFVPYPTSAVSALAFSRTSDNGYSGPLPDLKLAIGRANGDVEIWNPQNGAWYQESFILGEGKSIDGLAWTQEIDETDGEGQIQIGQQRLFGSASSPAITEWDLGTGQVKRRSTGNFSEVWCFAVQPRWRAQKDAKREDMRAQDVIAGCGDGTIVLLSTADNDLQFKRFLARVSGKRARCMCVAYQNRDRVVAGFADSMIRVYDTRNGSMLRTMSLGVGVPGAIKNALVWQIRCLPNGDLVSGDSNGEVKVWDGRTYSLAQRMVGHETDCLDLVTSSDGKTIFSGSIDGKMAVYKQSDNGGRKTWAKTSNRRTHNGEIRMAAFDSKGMSVVVSGGSDVAPVVTPLRQYGKENSRALPILPQAPPLASAPHARLVASWWNKTISVWRLAKQSNVEDVRQPIAPRKLAARLNIDTNDDIRSVSMSSDGRLLAASTGTAVKVFQLRQRPSHDSLAVRRLAVPAEIAGSGGRVVAFSPDCKWLATITPESEVYVLRVKADPERPKHLMILQKVVELDRRHHKRTKQTAFREYDKAINQVAFASDSSVLVTSDMSGCLDSWVLEGNEDPTAPAIDTTKPDSNDGSSDNNSVSSSESDSSDEDDEVVIFHGQHWVDNKPGHLLPRLDSAPLVMTFRPTTTQPALINGNPGVHATRHNPHAYSHELLRGEHKLWIMTSKHHMFEFNILTGRLSDWSRRNPTSALPSDFMKIRDRVMGAVWDHRQRLWLYGSSFVCMLNVGRDLGDEASPTTVKKRRRMSSDPRDNGAGDDDQRKRRKFESGAGGKIEDPNLQLVAEQATRYENGTSTKVDLSRASEVEDNDDDEEEDAALLLKPVRSRGDERESGSSSETDGGERTWWCTHKYRPILGMVPLLDDEEDEADRNRAVEVVIVERPLWDVRKDK